MHCDESFGLELTELFHLSNTLNQVSQQLYSYHILTAPLFSTGLWACTSECKVLGHSDRCWSPSATRPNTSLACGPHLSTFSKTASLPRDTRRENYYPPHMPKTSGLQSVYEKVQHQEFDYILVGPPTPARIQETDEISIPEYTKT